MDKRVFITGASSGIGAALARLYAQQGAMVGLVARRGDKLEQLVAGLPGPERHRWYALDVTDHAALAAAASDFISAAGGVDIVIANAGVTHGSWTQAEDFATFERIIATNLVATRATFDPFIPALKAQALAGSRAGRLVGIASAAGLRGFPGGKAYCASKAAMISYCESLRVELRQDGIKVVTIAPGFIATPMTEKIVDPMPFLMAVEDFAIAAAAAIDAGASFKIIPWQMGWLTRLLRAMPNWRYDAVISRKWHLAVDRHRDALASGKRPEVGSAD